MQEKKKYSPDIPSEEPNKKNKDEPKKVFPDPDDPNEQIGPPIKEMPIKDGASHPHDEEILDDIP